MMEKPFDVKDLEQRLAAAGLPQVEGMARAVVETTFSWIEDSVRATPSRIDDMLIAVVSPLKAYLLGKIDRISPAAPPAQSE